MGIRVVHQPAGSAVAAAAYMTGRNKARQRQQKDILDIWQTMQRRGGNVYRSAMGQQQQQGTWTDPSASPFLTSQDRVQLKAQRKSTARALRMGEPLPFPDAEPQFQRAPTKEEIRRQQELEDRAEGRAYQQQQEARKREYSRLDEAEQRTFDFTKARYGDLLERINEIKREGRGAWRDQKKASEFGKLTQNLDALRDAMSKGDIPGRMLEYYQKASDEMGRFLSGFDRSTHLLPFEEREGNIRTTDDGVRQRRTREGEWEFHGFADEGQLTREDIDSGKSNNYRRTPFGTYQQRKWGRYGIEWEDVQLPDAAQKRQDAITKRADKIYSETNEVGERKYSMEEALKQASEEQDTKEKFFDDSDVPAGPVATIAHDPSKMDSIDRAMTEKPVVINSPEDLSNLKPGSVFIGPDGKRRQYTGASEASPARPSTLDMTSTIDRETAQIESEIAALDAQIAEERKRRQSFSWRQP